MKQLALIGLLSLLLAGCDDLPLFPGHGDDLGAIMHPRGHSGEAHDNGHGHGRHGGSED